MSIKKKIEIKSKIISAKKHFFIHKFQNLYGIGINSLLIFSKRFGLNRRLKCNQINIETYNNISRLTDKLTHKNNLKSVLIDNRKFIIEKLKNYKGVRHLLRYPVRGQRTHTNGKTRKILKYDSICHLT